MNVFNKFRHWLGKQRKFRIARLSHDERYPSEPAQTLSELSEDIYDTVYSAVHKLPPNKVETDFIQTTVDSALTAWSQHPHSAANSIVILGHPIASISRLLIESLRSCQFSDEAFAVTILDWVERPPEINSIQSQLAEQLSNQETNNRKTYKAGSWVRTSTHPAQKSNLDPTFQEANSTQPDSPQRRLVIIPNLEWCFLRSTDGLDGIDYLQEELLSNREHFYVIGSGQVGWEYLKSTLKFHAYCGKVNSVPSLNEDQIREWLMPLIDKFKIEFDDANFQERLRQSSQEIDTKDLIEQPTEALTEIVQEVEATVENSMQTIQEKLQAGQDNQDEYEPIEEYFRRLCDLSDGISTVALQLMLASLKTQQPADDSAAAQAPTSVQLSLDQVSSPEQTAAQDPAPNGQDSLAPSPQLIATMPKLPRLPELSQSDLYLLYSLMLHGDLTAKALAQSLGDPVQIVTNQLQILRNHGLVEQQNKVVKINPVHYPKLHRELSRNNFVIEVT